MIEFNNRVSAQRDILYLVNKDQWAEELFGLSSGAIERWVSANSLGKNTDLVILINEAAEKLFFLSNKSQEQVTEEYKCLSAEVAMLTRKIAQALEWYRTIPRPSN